MKISHKLVKWVSYGLLLTPEKLPETIDMLKLVLQQSFVTPCYLNEAVQLIGEYENMCNHYKGPQKELNKQIKKLKKVFPEIAVLAVSPTAGPKLRKDRRDYARLELKQLVHLIQDYPGLLGPKIEVIWGALSLAKEELFWYFNQRLHSPAIKQQTKPFQSSAKFYRDPKISELITAVEEMVQLIRLYSHIVQEYYLSYLIGADFSQASALIQQAMGKATGNTSQALQAILDELQTISVEAFREGQDYYFEVCLPALLYEASLFCTDPYCRRCGSTASASRPGWAPRPPEEVHRTRSSPSA